jgi:hypothetical protein
MKRRARTGGGKMREALAEEARTPGGGVHASGGAHTPASGGARTPGRGAHASEWGGAHA